MFPSPLNFMIVGAQKCGTSALAHYLEQHPDICMAWGKEVHLFDLLAAVDFTPERIERFYQGYFEHYAGEALRGEATPAYWYFPHAVEHLARYNPALRLIVILRDPVDRAISHYAMERARGKEQRSINIALLFEPLRRALALLQPRAAERRRFHASYLDRGRYRRQWNKLRQHFPEHQLLLLHAADLRADPAAVLGRVYRFLELEPPATSPAPVELRRSETRDQPARLVRWWLNRRMAGERAWLHSQVPRTGASADG